LTDDSIFERLDKSIMIIFDNSVFLYDSVGNIGVVEVCWGRIIYDVYF